MCIEITTLYLELKKEMKLIPTVDKNIKIMPLYKNLKLDIVKVTLKNNNFRNKFQFIH